MPPSAHSRLSPSASKRWINCPGSIKASEGVADRGDTIYSRLGTAAHELMEICLRLDEPPEAFLGMKMNGEFPVDAKMAEGVGYAVHYVNTYLRKHPRTRLHLEHQVDVGLGLGRPDPPTFGTADIILDAYQIETADEVTVVDYKNGAGEVVEAFDNTQLLCYLLGYRSTTKRVPSRYRVVIIQPNAPHRLGPIREWLVDNKRLNEFAAVARAAAAEVDAPAPTFQTGEWCRWCPALPRCPAAAKASMAKAIAAFKPVKKIAENTGPFEPAAVDLLSDEDLAAAFQMLPAINAWSKAVMSEAMAVLASGRKLPGLKLVRGKSPPRQWAPEPDAVIRNLTRFLPLDVAAPRSPLSPTQAEKEFKTRELDFNKLSAIVVRGTPGLHVALASDPRPAATVAETIFTPIQRNTGDAEEE
jgi:hypothetical protein